MMFLLVELLFTCVPRCGNWSLITTTTIHRLPTEFWVHRQPAAG